MATFRYTTNPGYSDILVDGFAAIKTHFFEKDWGNYTSLANEFKRVGCPHYEEAWPVVYIAIVFTIARYFFEYIICKVTSCSFSKPSEWSNLNLFCSESFSLWSDIWTLIQKRMPPSSLKASGRPSLISAPGLTVITYWLTDTTTFPTRSVFGMVGASDHWVGSSHKSFITVCYFKIGPFAWKFHRT